MFNNFFSRGMVISHRQRLEECLAGNKVDRMPVALWRHFPGDDQTPEGLAAATLAYQRTFDFDLVKVTPASSFCLKDWGARDEWQGSSEGTRTYTHRVIQSPEDWTLLEALNPSIGFLADQLLALSLITQECGSHTPVLQTIFSPLAQAKNLVGGTQLLVHLRQHPQELHQGLRIITETTRRFVEAAMKTGIAGVFYAVQQAQFNLLSLQEFEEFGRFYDLQVLESSKSSWLNMVHLHGSDVMFQSVADYPTAIINWHDRDTAPSLTQALELFRGSLCGGLQREQSVVLGTPQKIFAEARQAAQAVGGKRLILGTGCVVPITAPAGNILAVRRSVEAE